MAVLDGCEAQKRTLVLKEITCPECGEVMEVFVKDGKAVEDAACEKCGHKIKEGDNA